MSHPFRTSPATLDRAVEAIADRGYWTAFPDRRARRSMAKAPRKRARQRSMRCTISRFPLSSRPRSDRSATSDRRTASRSASRTRSPISTACWRRSKRRKPDGAKPGPTRGSASASKFSIGSTRAFEIANAVMHTTGQAFMMAFQAGGPHAQDRGLEAVPGIGALRDRGPAHAVRRPGTP